MNLRVLASVLVFVGLTGCAASGLPDGGRARAPSDVSGELPQGWGLFPEGAEWVTYRISSAERTEIHIDGTLAWEMAWGAVPPEIQSACVGYVAGMSHIMAFIQQGGVDVAVASGGPTDSRPIFARGASVMSLLDSNVEVIGGEQVAYLTFILSDAAEWAAAGAIFEAAITSAVPVGVELVASGPMVCELSPDAWEPERAVRVGGISSAEAGAYRAETSLPALQILSISADVDYSVALAHEGEVVWSASRATDGEKTAFQSCCLSGVLDFTLERHLGNGHVHLAVVELPVGAAEALSRAPQW